MRIIRFAVAHPVAICMLMLLFYMGGTLAILTMEVELLPSISIPTLVVVTKDPKASPEDIHKEITGPMEEVLNSVGGLVSINSVSYEGESRIILEFDWGRNVDLAEVEVREQINTIKLPDEAKKPLVWKFDPSAAPIFRFDIFGRGGQEVSPEELRSLADDVIKSRIERISGVGEVAVLGGARAEYRVVARPAELARHKLTVPLLVDAIRDESINRKGGSITLDGGKQVAVRFIGKAESAADLEEIAVARRESGRTLRLRDVATVTRTVKQADSYARYNGKPSVGISIKKTSGASVVTVIKSIKEELAAMTENPQMAQVQMQVSQDDSEYVLNAQNMVLSSIFQGVLLAGALLILFLRDIRTTIVVGLATPISIVAAFMCLKALGLSRNVLTLGGMGLAAGMTLDSSIVLLDSIMKQIEMGKSPRDAAINGASEVAGGIFSSNMTTVTVFLPILFIPGLMREIFQDLSYAIIFAVLFAMAIGIVFIPMVSARILSAKRETRSNDSILLKPWAIMCRVMERFEAMLEGMLERILKFFFSGSVIKLVALLLLIVASILSLLWLPGRSFLPQGQVNELWVRFEAPVGSTLGYVDKRVRKVEELLSSQAPYTDFVEYVAANVDEDKGRIFVKLKPAKQIRRRDSQGRLSDKADDFQPMRPEKWHSLALCIQQIREGCDGIPDLKGKSFVTAVDKVRGGDSAPITLKIYRRRAEREGSEAESLQNLQAYVREKCVPAIGDDKVPSAFYERLKINETPRQIRVDTDHRRRRLHETGVTTQAISDTIRASVYGVEATSVNESGDDIDVMVMLGGEKSGDERPEFDPQQVRQMRVKSLTDGRLHQIRDVALVSDKSTEGSIVLERTNRKSTATLESNCVPYDISGHTIGDVSDQIRHSLSTIPGFTEEYTYDLKNTAKDTEESFADATKAFIISIILVYMIMCAQFERFSDPLAIMITVPLSAIGSVAMLRMSGEITSLGALVGAVILCGVVVNNGIILVEYINILRARGMARNEAIVSGSVRKIRSIVITSLTSILGMLPLVLGVGEGTELYRGVAAVIMGGLIVSTPLTLVALPILYSVLDDLGNIAGALAFRLSTMMGRK